MSRRTRLRIGAFDLETGAWSHRSRIVFPFTSPASANCFGTQVNTSPCVEPRRSAVASADKGSNDCGGASCGSYCQKGSGARRIRHPPSDGPLRVHAPAKYPTSSSRKYSVRAVDSSDPTAPHKSAHKGVRRTKASNPAFASTWFNRCDPEGMSRTSRQSPPSPRLGSAVAVPLTRFFPIDIAPFYVSSVTSPDFQHGLIVERSMMRPRDIIMFFNCCIDKAADQIKISLHRLREAEGVYSRNRLRSLADEWTSDYPNLIYFTRILRSRKRLFPATEITEQDIEDICFNFCSEPPTPGKDDILCLSANQLVDASADHDHFRKTILQVFYQTGMIGLKLETFETVQWTTLGARSVSKAEISTKCKVAIHPMLWRVFGVREK